jgi:hypothetical protein
MSKQPEIRPPGALSAPVASLTGPEAERHLGAVLQTLLEIVAGLDRLEERLDSCQAHAAPPERILPLLRRIRRGWRPARRVKSRLK